MVRGGVDIEGEREARRRRQDRRQFWLNLAGALVFGALFALSMLEIRRATASAPEIERPAGRVFWFDDTGATWWIDPERGRCMRPPGYAKGARCER